MWREVLNLVEFLDRPAWKADFGRYSLEVKSGGCKLSELVSIKSDGEDPKKVEPDTPYIGLENIESNTGILRDVKTLENCGIRGRSKFCRAGDLLFGRLRPNLNKVAVVPEDFPLAMCSTEIFVLRPYDNTDPYLLWALLSASQVVNYFAARTSGTTLPRLKKEDILTLELPHYSERKKLSIASKAVHLRSKVTRLESELSISRNELDRYRHSLWD